MKKTRKLSSLDIGLVQAPPMAAFFEFRDKIDVEQLYFSVLKTLKLFPTFSAKFLDEGEYVLCCIPNYFGFNVFESSNNLLSSLPHRNTPLKNLNILGTPSSIKQPVLNIFLVQKANGSQLTINLSHAVADGASLKIFAFQLISFLKKRDSKRTLFPQRNLYLEEFNQKIDSRLNYKNHKVSANYSFRKGYFNDFVIPFEKVINIYKQIYSNRGIENLKLHDVLSSLLLKCLISHFVHNSEKINIVIPIDIRNLVDSLDSYYIGNGFVDAFHSWEHEEFILLNLVELAMQIRHTINKFSNTKFLNNKIKMTEHGLSFQEFSKEEIHDFTYDKCIALTSLGRANRFTSVSECKRLGILADNLHTIASFRINRNYIINVTSLQKLPASLDLLRS